MQEQKKLSGSKMKAAVDQQLATFKTNRSAGTSEIKT
jgi:hypothetical protein